MRKLVALLAVGLTAVSAFAGQDPATDSFGVYFDMDGSSHCTTAAASELVTAYLVLMNPDGPTNGFECTVERTGAAHILLSTTIRCLVCDDADSTPDGYAVGAGVDFPIRPSGAVVLLTWVMLVQDTSELMFRIGPGTIPSLPGGLPVVSGNGVLRLCGVASGDVNLPVAGINAGANCPVSEEIDSFGAVKSLFR